MTEEFVNTAICNIQLIQNSSNESLHISEFIFNENEGVYLSELVQFLVDNDFIETDGNPNIYFLTPDTYDLTDIVELEIAIWSKANSDDPIEEEVFFDESQTPKRKWYNGIKSYFAMVLILFSIGTIYYFSVTSFTKQEPRIHLNQELLDNLKKDIQIKLDSTKKTNFK